jgi:hypothetical protein
LAPFRQLRHARFGLAMRAVNIRKSTRLGLVQSERLGLNHGGRSLRLGEAAATPFRRVGSRAAGVDPIGT